MAIKCPLLSQVESDPEMTSIRAVKELRLLSRAAEHENILKLFGGVMMPTGEIWIVTELIREGDLYTVSKKQGGWLYIAC